MHPFVALMRRYCIDYTNAHDPSRCDELMEPDYVVHLSGFDLRRDESYRPAVVDLFARAPGLGLVVHELVCNGDRLCMRFSEHAALPMTSGVRLACWRGIGLYKWNGARLTENYVEQDFFAQHRQLEAGQPDELEAPHLDPWVGTEIVAPNGDAERAVRDWIALGELTDAATVRIDGTSVAPRSGVTVDVDDITVNDLFSAGRRVAFHVTARGGYRGGLEGVPDSCLGKPATLHIAALADVAPDGRIADLRAVTTRQGVAAELTGVSPV